jgi:ubiquinol-cytochrome c reductase cytochrome b subunit
MLNPFIFDDEENSKIANEIRSPIHIKPEWYFLFAYAILRSIPNKLGGVIAIAIRVIFFYFFIVKKNKKIRKNRNLIISIFIFSCFLLTWIGANPVEDPYILIGQILLLFYFLLIIF